MIISVLITIILLIIIIRLTTAGVKTIVANERQDDGVACDAGNECSVHVAIYRCYNEGLEMISVACLFPQKKARHSKTTQEIC